MLALFFSENIALIDKVLSHQWSSWNNKWFSLRFWKVEYCTFRRWSFWQCFVLQVFQSFVKEKRQFYFCASCQRNLLSRKSIIIITFIFILSRNSLIIIIIICASGSQVCSSAKTFRHCWWRLGFQSGMFFFVFLSCWYRSLIKMYIF
jgi:hypothetical protein